jgi:hypothetical protein
LPAPPVADTKLSDHPEAGVLAPVDAYVPQRLTTIGVLGSPPRCKVAARTAPHPRRMTTAQHPVDRFLGELSSGTGITPEIWTHDVELDATVPHWRFGRTGAAQVAAELSGWFDAPITIEAATRRPIPGGEAVELELTWVEDGVPHAAHQLHLLTVDGDRLSRDTVFCGGRWPAELLAEMEAAREAAGGQ